MITLQPVKDQAYTVKDLLMKSGMYDDEEDDDMVEMDKKGRRPKRSKARPTQQIIQKTTVIVGDVKKQRKRRPKMTQTRKREMVRQPPSYGISTGASGVPFTPFYPPAPLYRNMVAGSAPTTTDNITASQKRIENITSGAVINAIETKADKVDILTKVEDVINTQREKQQIAEDYFESQKTVEKEESKPPSFEEAIGSVEYKTQEEQEQIQRIKEEYESGLTLKNQKKKQKKAREQLKELGQFGKRLEEVSNIQDELLREAEKMNKRLIEESQKQVDKEQEPESKPEPKEIKKRRTKQEIQEGKMMEEADKQKKREDIEKAFDEFSSLYDEDELQKLELKGIIEDVKKMKETSNPSDENMSSRVQSFKRGHIIPMLPRYI